MGTTSVAALLIKASEQLCERRKFSRWVQAAEHSHALRWASRAKGTAALTETQHGTFAREPAEPRGHKLCQ